MARIDYGTAARIVFDMGDHEYEATVHDCTAILRFYENNAERIKGATVADYGTIYPPALDRTLAMATAAGRPGLWWHGAAH